MTVTIICSRKPRKVLFHSKDHVVFDKVENGYYVSHDQPPVHIIVINELAMIPKNYPLLVFAASEKKFRQFLRQTFEEGNLAYFRYAYAVRPTITKEELIMARRRHYRLSNKELAFVAQDIGPELLPFFSPDDRLQGLSPHDLLRHLSSEEQLRQLSASEREQLRELLDNLEDE